MVFQQSCALRLLILYNTTHIDSLPVTEWLLMTKTQLKPAEDDILVPNVHKKT